MLISTTIIQLVSRLNPNCFSLGRTIHGRCLVVPHLKFQRQEEKKASVRSQENPWSTGFAEEKPKKKPRNQKPEACAPTTAATADLSPVAHLSSAVHLSPAAHLSPTTNLSPAAHLCSVAQIQKP